VTITPEVTSRGVNRAVMEQLVRLYRDSHLGKRLPAYDGRKSLYTAGPLPFISKDFRITLVDEDDGSGGQRSVYYIYYHLFLHVNLSLIYLVNFNCLIDFHTGGTGSSKLL
jgi:hypothetical protein